ncbi:MAG TPA: EAL domain-containing protein [Miltoncostaea sp.]|nr:EAL domain-containing protein [Miltoncostaea sp.]
MPTGTAVLVGRFLVGREIRGGAGRTMWEGTEASGGAPVRIERAPERAVSPATIMRLEHARAALPDGVPGLVAPVRAVGREDGGIHLVTAMPPGTTLDALDGPLPLRDALAVASDVLGALAELHGSGILHRDLDCAAVILREDDGVRATITAAGLAADVALIASVADLPAAEVAHLAPEASGLIAGGVDERSDLWSAGVLIHRCITGRPPRDAATAAELLRETLAGPVPGLRRLVPDAPRVLEEAVGRLLERDPRDRYQSARAAAADFAAIAAAVAAGDAEPHLVLGAQDERAALTEPAFVGRREELAGLEAQIRRAREGAGCLVTLEAPSGGGKTRLLEELVGRAVEEGLWVLRGGGVDQAAAQPFQLLGGVVREVVRAASADAVLLEGLTARLGEEAAAASAAMPELAEIVGPADEGGLGPEQHAEARSIRALTAFLDALGAPGREAVVILDDAQWADELSLRLLTAWARRAAPDRRVLLIAAFREEEVHAGHPLRAVGAREHLRLPALGDAEVASLATTMAGTLPAEALDAVERLSGGNPFMATAVLRGLVESAALRRDRGGWRVSQAALADVSSSRAAADVLLARVDMLPAATLGLLTAGAVLGKAFEIPLAAELAAQEPAGAIASLAEARRRNIVWTDQDESQVIFVHDKLREALLARVDPEELGALHRAAARRIEAAHPDWTFELAYHYDAGGEPERAVPHAMRAAAIARGRHALAAAESHYRIALAGEAHLDDAGRRALANGLGDVLMMNGGYEEARLHLERAREMSDDPQAQAEVDGRLGELFFKRGDVEAAIEAYERGLRLLDQRVPRGMGGFLRQALREVLVQAGHSIAPGLAVGRRAPIPDDAAEMLAIRLYSRLAYPYWFGRGAVQTLWSHLRGMNLAERYPPTLELAQAYSEHAPVMTVLPWFSRGLDYADRSLAIRRDLGDVWGQGQSLHFRGVVLYGASRFRECIASCEEAVGLLERTGDRWEMNTAAWHVAICEYRLGNLGEAVERAREVHRAGREIGDAQAMGITLGIWSKASGGEVPAELVAAERDRGGGDVHTQAELVQAEALRLMSSGRHAAAASMLRACLRTVERRGFRQEYVAPLAPWLATAMRLQLEDGTALSRTRRAVVTRRARAASRRALLWSRHYRNNQPHALRERALILALTGSGGRADRLLDRSAAEAERQDAVYELALTQHARARLAVDRGDHGAAEALREAALELERLRGGAEVDPRAAAALSLADRFDAVLVCGRQIAAALTPSAVVEAARSAAMVLLRAERTEVTEVSAGTAAEAPALWPPGEAAPDPDRLLSGEPLVVTPAAGGSHMYVAIHADGRPAAVLGVHHAAVADLFGPEEVRLAEYIATLTGAALENAATTAQLEHQAFHDPLTGLANRALVLDRLSQALLRAERRHEDLCVMLLDLADFKTVNDSLGHAAGDRLLTLAADRLRGVLRPTDTPARLGGDEFAVLLEDADVETAAAVADRIIAAFREPFDVGGREVFVSATIGIAAAAEGERNAEALVRDADAAMYTAKEQGKRGYALFVPQMRTAAVARLEMETRLRNAAGRGELELVYQPIVRIADGAVVGLEALVRWRHPELGRLGPGDFIPLAEQTGVIDEIGEWVLRTACRDVAALVRGDGGDPPAVTVNLSPRQLRNVALADVVEAALRDTGLPPGRLVLEITETAMAADTPGNLASLRALRRRGVRVAVDDFGSGYSSLGQLRRLPVDMLKIDREFLREARSTQAAALLRAVVDLGNGLGLAVVAEGVERQDQLALVQGVGCDLGQGWLWARPMGIDDIATLLGP